MPWELSILKFDGPAPSYAENGVEESGIPLGTFEEVKRHITTALPQTQWIEEEPFIELIKRNGSDSWKEWDEEELERNSRPHIVAIYERDDVYIEMFGFEPKKPVTYICTAVRGADNPVPALQALCNPNGWSVYAVGGNQELVDLNGDASSKWEEWQAKLQSVISDVITEDEETG